MAFSDAVKLDLKAFGLGGRAEVFRSGGEMDRAGNGASSLSICIKGCSSSQLSERGSRRTLGLDCTVDIDGEGLALSAELKSSGDASEAIDAVERDRVVRMPASNPSLPTIISPSINSSM